jgi:hypothetical protein
VKSGDYIVVLVFSWCESDTSSGVDMIECPTKLSLVSRAPGIGPPTIMVMDCKFHDHWN